MLGVLPGIVGSIQANEAIKWLAGIGDTLAGRLLLIDALRDGVPVAGHRPRPRVRGVRPRAERDGTHRLRAFLRRIASRRGGGRRRAHGGCHARPRHRRARAEAAGRRGRELPAHRCARRLRVGDLQSRGRGRASRAARDPPAGRGELRRVGTAHHPLPLGPPRRPAPSSTCAPSGSTTPSTSRAGSWRGPRRSIPRCRSTDAHRLAPRVGDRDRRRPRPRRVPRRHLARVRPPAAPAGPSAREPAPASIPRVFRAERSTTPCGRP